MKRLILLNLPYVFAFYFVDKVAAVFRLAPGSVFVEKLTGGFANFGTAFANPLPSFHPMDLLVGVAAGLLLKLAVYIKGKNRKKFRQGEEYGSARWGRPEDIKPYVDDRVLQNIILTQTEALTYEQPSQAAEVREEQEHPRYRRFRLRQDQIFRQAQPHADAQFLLRH
jgi:type IV secretion system protein VirD4